VQELTRLIADRLQQPADVLYAVRFVDEKPVRGYWYRLFKDQTRAEPLEFGYLGRDRRAAERAIERMAQERRT
jgi:hypothetical protein